MPFPESLVKHVFGKMVHRGRQGCQVVACVQRATGGGRCSLPSRFAEANRLGEGRAQAGRGRSAAGIRLFDGSRRELVSLRWGFPTVVTPAALTGEDPKFRQ